MTIEELIAHSGELGSLPAVVIRINEAIDNPNSNASQIGRIVNEDPALTAQLLKIVNSPFYGFRSRIDTVFRAIAIIGHRELRHLVLTAHAMKTFNNVPNDLISMPVFWKRSLYVGVLTRVLAAYSGEREIERLFISGLLHDIGSLLIYNQMPEQAAEIIRRSRAEDESVAEIEQEVLGYDHAQVGGALLEAWSLPPVLVEAVRNHLEPSKAPEEFRKPAQIVNLASEIHHHYIEQQHEAGDDLLVDKALFDVLEISPDSLAEMLTKAEMHFKDANSLIR